MPTMQTSVGGTTIPFPAATGAPIEDRAVVVLLSYLSFWLRYALNDALAALGTTTDTADESYDDACPGANIFPYDPRDVWPQNPKPALYIWWNGQTREVPKTLVYSLRERGLGFMWIFSQITYPDGDPARAGIQAAVDAVFRRALERGRHPEWGYGSFPVNSHAAIVAGIHGWKLLSSEPGMLAPVVEGNAAGHEQNVYPAVRGVIQVVERIYDDQPLAHPSGDDPSDVLLEQTFGIRTNELGDPNDQYDFGELILPRP